MYDIINLKLPDDDWQENNSVTDVAPGSSYPPVILNEILADPKAPLATEWVEIKNRSNLAIDLNGWSLGNADILYPIASSELILDPAQIMVLCKDSLAFVDFYGQGGYPIRQPDGWPTLRNTGDLVQIQDNFEFTADTFYYDDGFGDNYTWGRYNASVTDVIWGQSRDVGGTPGENNSIYQPPSSTQIEVTVDPNPFSFSRDGIMHIDISVPEGEAMTARVYDRDGREMRTLIDSEKPYDESLEWDGTTDGGRSLPPGIYILYVEVSGSGTHKQTIVLSP